MKGCGIGAGMKKSLGAKTLLYPAPVWVVGSYGTNRTPNVMTAAWGGICCSDPPCVAVSLRKATYTYSNIMERKAFTVNIPSAKFIQEADYFGLVSGREEDKFAMSGMTAEGSTLVDAPFVKEFPVIVECRLRHILEIGLHTLFVGEIFDVKADEEILGEQGFPDLSRLRPLVFDPGLHGYYEVGEYRGRAFSAGRKR
jgi:flavin reductase (DIM6/NTAB) family NADH-FMN oxidoreductase RutF